MGGVYAVVNQKGGVGKTTTAVNLAACAALDGGKVLLVDLDAQGNATSGLGIERSTVSGSMFDVVTAADPADGARTLEDIIVNTEIAGLSVCPANIDLAGADLSLANSIARELRLRKALVDARERYDLVLVDTGPSLGILTINALTAAEWVLVPIQCEYYALEGLSQLLRNVHLVAANLNSSLEVSTIVLTMYDARTRLAIEVANEVRTHFSDKVCKSVIPRSVRLSEAPSFGQPITVFDPTSRGAVAYRELAREVSNGAPRRAG